MNRMRTPRAAARRIASPTIAAVSAPRLKSYCASSSDVSAPSTNAATACATSAGCWPPSIRVRISMRSLIDRLAAARIGQTTNFYRVGAGAALRRARLAAYVDARAGAPILLVGEAPGYRGARVSGIPFTSERQLTGAGPAEATATIVHRVPGGAGGGDGDDRAPRARRARARRARPALERRSDPSRHCDDEPPADARRDRA